MTALLDGNLLIALGDRNHVHHGAAEQWFAQRDERAFATCPLTQSTLLRHLMREKITTEIGQAVTILRGFLTHPGHRFWPDSVTYDVVAWKGVLGHRQITGAYLAGRRAPLPAKGTATRLEGGSKKPPFRRPPICRSGWCWVERAGKGAAVGTASTAIVSWHGRFPPPDPAAFREIERPVPKRPRS